MWEWTLDFDAYTMTDDGAFTCGGAAASASDSADYPAFMRYSMRASLKANYTADNLGFRCAGRAMRLRVLFGAALAALALGVAATRAHDHAQGGMATITAAPTGASIYNLDSTWTSQDGTSVPLDAFAGKPVVAAMGYTSCRGLCPAIVADMMWIDGRLPLALPTG